MRKIAFLSLGLLLSSCVMNDYNDVPRVHVDDNRIYRRAPRVHVEPNRIHRRADRDAGRIHRHRNHNQQHVNVQQDDNRDDAPRISHRRADSW